MGGDTGKKGKVEIMPFSLIASNKKNGGKKAKEKTLVSEVESTCKRQRQGESVAAAHGHSSGDMWCEKDRSQWLQLPLDFSA